MPALLAFVLMGASALAAPDPTGTPADPDVRHLFYLHGRIIEEQGLRPEHPEFGVYEYEDILAQLRARGLQVHAEARPSGADVAEYADKTVGEIRALLAAGVPAERITVMGFSKGGAIAVMTAARLGEPRVNFVFLACCFQGILQNEELSVTGKILSIYEESDVIGRSCGPLFSRSNAGPAHREIMIETGLKHGAFYRVQPEWFEPAVAWALEAGAPPR